MEISESLVFWAAAAGTALLVLGIYVYWDLIRQLRLIGGKVDVQKIRPPELAVAMILITWFGLVIAQNLFAPQQRVDQQQLVSASTVFLIVVAFLSLFLHFRGIRLRDFLGVDRVSPVKVFSLAVGMLLPTLPLILAVSIFTQLLLGSKAQSQEIVEFFMEASKNHDQRSLLMVGALGVLVAPVAEEFIFRGFLYTVFKRFLGAPLALVLNAALFAAIHVNVSSLGALFVLAMAFTLAYEITGSLLVSMAMHAIFNFSSLALIYLTSNLQ